MVILTRTTKILLLTHVFTTHEELSLYWTKPTYIKSFRYFFKNKPSFLSTSIALGFLHNNLHKDYPAPFTNVFEFSVRCQRLTFFPNEDPLYSKETFFFNLEPWKQSPSSWLGFIYKHNLSIRRM